MSEDSLCEELMVEILKRLPPKSLVRFRSVSKSLRSCIDSPGFIRMHTSRSPQRLVMTHMVKYKYRGEYGDGAFCTLHAQDQLPLCPIRGYVGITTHKFPRRNVNMVGSCNGILCLFDATNGIITLWNPSIMRQLTLPDCPQRCISGLGIGLGFNPNTDDIEIVSIPIYGYGNGNEGIVKSPFVYAMKTRAWSPIASPMPVYATVKSRALYLNGILHWVVEEGAKVGEFPLCYIMTFDLSTHAFGMIASPHPDWDIAKLATIQGCLAVISDARLSNDGWIWVKRDAFWTVVFKAKTNGLESGVAKVLELTNNGDLLLDAFFDGFQVYNPKTGARSTLVDSNDTSSLFEMDIYVESLQLLNIGTACEPNHLNLQEKKIKRI